MATAYKTVEQAQAAYDTVLQQKQRQQRNDYINQQQAIMGVNNYLKQQGYNGGAAESILLKIKGSHGDYSAYDNQLAELAALIRGMKKAAAGRRRSTSAAINTSALEAAANQAAQAVKNSVGRTGQYTVGTPAAGAMIAGAQRMVL